MVNHLTVRHFIEQFFRTRNLRLLYRSEIKCFHCTFSFSNEEYVLNCSLVKSDCPVRRIISYWSRNLERSWKFCIYTYFFCCIQIFSKSSLNTLFCRAISKYIILNRFLCKECLIKTLGILFGCEDCTIVFSFNRII